MRNLLYIPTLIFITLSLSACNAFNPNNTIWDAAKQVGTDTANTFSRETGIRNRTGEYKDSDSVPALVIPKNLSPTQMQQYYQVPKVQDHSTPQSDSMLPPGSLLARSYIDKTYANTLSSEKLKSVHASVHMYDSLQLNINTNFNLSWDVLGLAIKSNPRLILVKQDRNKGVYYFANRNEKGADGKPAMYRVVLQGDAKSTRASLINAKQQVAATGIAGPILNSIAQQINLLNKQRGRIVAIINHDVYKNLDAVINRNYSVSYRVLTAAMPQAGLQVVKANDKSFNVFFVDPAETGGKLKSNMPLYTAYVRDKGLYTLFYILGPDGKLLDAKKSKPMFERLVAVVDK